MAIPSRSNADFAAGAVAAAADSSEVGRPWGRLTTRPKPPSRERSGAAGSQHRAGGWHPRQLPAGERPRRPSGDLRSAGDRLRGPGRLPPLRPAGRTTTRRSPSAGRGEPW